MSSFSWHTAAWVLKFGQTQPLGDNKNGRIILNFSSTYNLFFRYYDESGMLYYHDRLKDLIKYNNIHIYPNAIEEVLYQHEDVVEAGEGGNH